MDKKAQTVDEFIAPYPEEIQKSLESLRSAVREVIPDAGEKISYGIPTFTYRNKNVVHFSAYKTHIGFYPGAEPIEKFKKELKPYKTAKGTVQFPLGKPLPLDLVKKMTKYRLDQLK